MAWDPQGAARRVQHGDAKSVERRVRHDDAESVGRRVRHGDAESVERRVRFSVRDGSRRGTERVQSALFCDVAGLGCAFP